MHVLALTCNILLYFFSYGNVLTLSPPSTTKVSYANSLDPDETPSNSASHPDQNFWFFPTLSDIKALWKLKRTRSLADENLFSELMVNPLVQTKNEQKPWQRVQSRIWSWAPGPVFTKKSKMRIRIRINFKNCHYFTKYHVNWMTFLPYFQEG